MRRRVVLVTDGDEYAKRTIELLTKEFGGRCISASQSNPTKLTGKKVVELICKRHMTLYLSCLMTVDLLEKDLVKRL